MRIPLTLSFYIGRQFLISIAVVLAGMMLLTLLMDFVELLRRTTDKDQVPIAIILEMAFLRSPYMGGRVLPFAVLIGGILALSRLTRTSELIVARAAGISVWQFLAPAIALAMIIGVSFTTVINPISSAMLSRFEAIEGKYITGRPSLLSVSSSGLWLRQVEPVNETVSEYIIHALRIAQQRMEISEVIVFMFDKEGNSVERMDAKTATLHSGYWLLKDAVLYKEDKPPVSLPETRLTTSLTIAQIQDSFASPTTLSFWQLPGFISLLEQAGFSALNHRIYWQSLLALPFLLSAMILMGALFSLRLPRKGGVTLLLVAGIVVGFSIHFLSNLVAALGQSGSLPVELAAWSPALATAMTGAGLLLHFEDG